MQRRIAKELLHVRNWLDAAAKVCADGKQAYLGDELLQEAGDALMMKLGEAASRLARAGVEPPADLAWSDAIANRNWLIHQYDQIDRDITWSTLARDLPAWRALLADKFAAAQQALEGDGASSISE